MIRSYLKSILGKERWSFDKKELDEQLLLNLSFNNQTNKYKVRLRNNKFVIVEDGFLSGNPLKPLYYGQVVDKSINGYFARSLITRWFKSAWIVEAYVIFILSIPFSIIGAFMGIRLHC